jgi:signal transduction histidine kinase
VVLLLGLLLGANIILPLAYRLHPVVRVLDYLGTIGLSLFAATLCFRRAGREGPGAFRFLGLGVALSGLKYVPVFLVLPHYLVAGPAIATLGLLALGVGLLSWPQRIRMPGERIRTLLDGLMITLSVFMAAWMFLEKAVQLSSLPWAVMILNAVLVSGSFGLLALWLIQEARLSQPDQSRATTLVRAAVLAILLHSLGGALLRTLGLYDGYQAHAVDVFNQLAVCLIGLASIWPPERGERPLPSSKSGWRALIPTGGAVAILLLVAYRIVAPGAGPQRPLTMLGIAVLVILLLRQGLLILDLEHLSRDLEARVEERTRRLEVHHREALRQQRMQMVAGLAAGLAHDLNNLLNVIRIRVDLLWERAAPSQRQDLDIMVEATERAKGMTRRILTASRGQESTPLSFNLADWLEGQASLIRAQLSRGQTLRLEVPPRLQVIADPEQLDQVIQNLTSNAREAMSSGGTLTLSARSTGHSAALEVIDTGPGMTAELAAQIFDPFFTTKPHGTGLGLATVRNLVLQNRGTISVESAPGRGTRFRINLPLAEDSSEVPMLEPGQA